MQYTIKNEFLTIVVNQHGAELSSIQKNVTNTEYLWNADPAFWGRHSPVLFPIVGSLKEKQYHYNGITYPMNQHGFARDMDFELLSQTNDQITFCLKSTTDTLKKYPFKFELLISYQLISQTIQVTWEVNNENATPMYFSIGGHPAFLCPLHSGESQTDCFICMDTSSQEFSLRKLTSDGLIKSETETMQLVDSCLPISQHLFDEDALVVEGNQAHHISLLDSKKQPYLSVHFDAPLFGLWSPAKKNAPFVCIEPWYGRCDAKDFDGSLPDREYGNRLEPQETFKKSYQIEIH